MQTLDIARWQFAITTIYHFLLVPITIGLSGTVALMGSGDASGEPATVALAAQAATQPLRAVN